MSIGRSTKISTRLWGSVAVAASAALVFTGCAAESEPGGAEDAIIIGFNGELTGVYTDFGAKALIAAQMAADEINEAGGVDGREIEIVSSDNRSTPEDSVVVMQELVSRGAVAVIGPTVTATAEVGFPAANQSEIVAISSGSAKAGLSAENRPWTFRISQLDTISTLGLATYLQKERDVSKVGIIYDGADAYAASYGKSTLPAVLDDLGLDYESRETQSGQRDFSVEVTAMANAGLDAIALCHAGQDSAAVMQEIARQSLDVEVFGCAVVATQAVIDQAGASGEGVLAAQAFYAGAEGEKVQDFVAAFSERVTEEHPNMAGKTPSYIEVGAWEAVHIIAESLRGVAADTPIAEQRVMVRDYFADLKDFQGLSSKITVDEDGDATKSPLYILEVVDGTFTVISEIDIS